MKNPGILFFIIVATLFCSIALADEITLKNGDRITGNIVKSDAKSLTIKTDYAGDLTVQRSAIQKISSTQTLHIVLKDGQTLVGTVATTDDKLQLSTTSGPQLQTPTDSVVMMRSDSEQKAYEKSLHPGWRENWAAGTNLGFALTRGNSQTKNLALAFNANRTTLHDKLSLYANSVYSTNDAAGAIPSTTANAEQGGIRYDHDLTPRLFAFVGADFQADALQTLNLRSILGGGLGFHVIKRPSTTLDLLAGANYTRENYDAFKRNFAAATLGEEFMHKLRGSTSITQNFYFYPNLSNTGEYRWTLNFGTVTKISKRLGWQNSFGDIYVSDPPVGKKNNDILFTTGLNVAFGH